jgi:AmmeMemoRadiSam system protein A
MARAAALDDPRFDPIGPRELAELSFEISVLGPLRRVERPAKAGSFEIGVDGLVVSMGPRSGLLLPQVATEHGFDRIGFLEEACAKAGLPRDAWRSGAEVYAFAAEVF